MKSTAVCFLILIFCTSCLDHLLEPDVEDASTINEVEKISTEKSVHELKAQDENIEQENLKSEKTGQVDLLADDTSYLETEAGGIGNILVDELRVREQPSLDGKLVMVLSKGSIVTVKELTDFKTEVSLNNKLINDVWYQIITKQGVNGWVHGCCIEVTWP